MSFTIHRVNYTFAIVYPHRFLPSSVLNFSLLHNIIISQNLEAIQIFTSNTILISKSFELVIYNIIKHQQMQRMFYCGYLDLQ
jgi:hypothetical protein